MKLFLPALLLCSMMPLLAFADVPPEIYPNLQKNGKLTPCVSGFLGQTLQPYVLPVDTELIERRNKFGFSQQEIQKQVEENIRKEKAKFEKARADYASAVEKWNAGDETAKAKMQTPGPEPEDGSNDFRNMALGPTMQGTLGLDYDFAYNFMTDEQRNIIRKAL